MHKALTIDKTIILNNSFSYILIRWIMSCLMLHFKVGIQLKNRMNWVGWADWEWSPYLDTSTRECFTRSGGHVYRIYFSMHSKFTLHACQVHKEILVPKKAFFVQKLQLNLRINVIKHFFWPRIKISPKRVDDPFYKNSHAWVQMSMF
jgi:hypothetical protein